METRISGIPCRVEVNYFERGYAAKTNADPDSCYEGADDQIEFTVCDRRGRPAPWLQKKMTDEDVGRIEQELIAEREEEESNSW